ncbi:MAG: hypothetical protein OXC40_02695 [Proteobacteria bacterium]|nr:hypothetical protein [Pseudomonadota bacterium]
MTPQKNSTATQEPPLQVAVQEQPGYQIIFFRDYGKIRSCYLAPWQSHSLISILLGLIAI